MRWDDLSLEGLRQESTSPVGMKKVKLGSVLAALVMFAFPWLDIQCSGKSFATQTGFQVIIGDASPNPQMEAAFADGDEKELSRDESMGDANDLTTKQLTGDLWDHFWDRGSLLVALALIAIIGAFGFSFIAVFRDSERTERLTSVLSASALLLLLVQLVIGFPVKRLLDEDMSKKSSDSQAGDDGFGSEMEEVLGAMVNFQVNKTPVFYLELLALGIPTLLLLRNGRKDAKPVTGPTKALHTECENTPFADAENIEPRTKEIVVPAPVTREKAPLTPAPKRKGASRLVAGLLAGASGGVVCGSIVLIGMAKINETTNDKHSAASEVISQDNDSLLDSSSPETSVKEINERKEIVSRYKAFLATSGNSLSSESERLKKLKSICATTNQLAKNELAWEYFKYRKQFIESRSDDLAYLDKWDLSSSYGRVIAQAAHSTIGINFDVGEDVYLDEITGWLETELQGLAGKDLIDFLSIEDSGIAEGSCRDFSGGDPPRYMPRTVALGVINHPQLFVAISKYENFLLSYPDSPARHSVLEKLEFLYPLLSKGSSKSPIINLSHSDLSTLHGYEFNEGLAARLQRQVNELKVSGSYRKHIDYYLSRADPRWLGHAYIRKLLENLENNENRALAAWSMDDPEWAPKD